MKIFPNYVLSSSRVNKKYNQSFGQTNPQVDNDTAQKSDNIQQVTKDYNVSVPMAYSKVRDIQLPNSLVAHCYKLANGQQVVIVPKKGSTVVKSYINTGSLNEPDNLRGISHYIEHNLFNGSEALGDKVFFEEVNKLGAGTNASTSFSVTDYFIDSQLLEDTDLENEIKLHAGMLQTPKFLEEKLAKEKNIVNSEINMYLSDDYCRAHSLVLKNLFNINSKAPDLVAGSTENIDALTRDDVVEYFNNNYYPANTVTVITGEVNPEDTMGLVSKYFNSTKTQTKPRYFEPMTPTDKPIRQDIISKKNEGEASIILGFCGPENGNNVEKTHMRAVRYLLGGLANSRLKNLEQKYSTSIQASNERLGARPNDNVVELIETGVPEAYVEPLLKDLYSVIDGLSKNPPTVYEFEAVKNQLKKQNSITLQSSHSLNYHIGMNFLNGTPDNMSEQTQIIDSMTYQDFINAAKKYYDLNKVSIAVVHPSGTSETEVMDNYNRTKPAQIPFTGSNKKTPIETNNINQYLMPNNYNIVLNDTNSDVVNYALDFDTKDMTPKKAAAADVLMDIINNSGTYYRSKDNLDTMCDVYGIKQGFGVSSYGIELSAEFPAEKTNEALNLFTEKLKYPQFTQELFAQGIQHCKDIYTTEEPSARYDFYKSIYKNTPRQYTPQDKLESLNNLTLSDVVNLYMEILRNSQAQIVVTGPFSKNPYLAQTIFNNTSYYKPVKPKDTSIAQIYTPTESPEVYTVETKKNQAQILEGFKFKDSGNVKDTLCLQLLSSILGGGTTSRLFNDLRESRHLAYSVHSMFSDYGDIGTMVLSIGTTTNNTETGENTFDNIKKSIEGFNENIQKIMNEKVSEDELAAAKKLMKTDLLSMTETDSYKTEMLCKNMDTPYGVNYLNEKFRLIDSITADDILNAAKYVFSSKPVYAISATKDSLEANKEFIDGLKQTYNV